MSQKIIGKPCAGKPHARIERGTGKRIRTADTAPLTTNDGLESFSPRVRGHHPASATPRAATRPDFFRSKSLDRAQPEFEVKFDLLGEVVGIKR